MSPSQVAPLPRRAHAALLSATLALLGACSSGPRPSTVPAPVRPEVPAATPADLPAPAAAAPLVAAAPRPHLHLPGVTFDLDVHAFEDEERVQHYVRLFSGSARSTFTAWLSRGSRYDAMIRAKLRAGGLPEDLIYLPLVESGYEPNAVSRVSAVGMWQFMAPTARDVGLRVDWWVDERRDPVRATDGAVRMLKWLKKEFGSYFVAAAAYNGGPTRVSRGLAQLAAASDSTLGEARFFALVDADYLRPETKNYVPQLIAAALVAKELPRYDLSVREQPAFAYDSVTVAPLTPLAAVARASGASRAELLDLNPQYLRGLTPPDGRATVRVPVGAAAGFASRLAKLDADARRAFRRVTTRKRETLAAIARREEVPLATLAAYNPALTTVRTGKWKGRLVSGQAVRVPTTAVLEYGRAAADADDGEGAGELPALPAARVAERPAPRPEREERRGAAGGETEREEQSTVKPAAKIARAKDGEKSAETSAAKRVAKAAAGDDGAPAALPALATVAREKPAKATAKSTAKSSVKASAKAKAGASKAPARKSAGGRTASVRKPAAKAAASSRARGAKAAKGAKGAKAANATKKSATNANGRPSRRPPAAARRAEP